MNGDYVFGYGSIINNESRISTSEGPVALARMGAGLGWARSWNFRSPTGFTALGLMPVTVGLPINGVVFCPADFDAFKDREQGYYSHKVDATQLEVLGHTDHLKGLDTATIWVFVPLAPQEPSKDYPICQSYVDVCLNGCLDWGGEPFAVEFLQTTLGWSPFFLNDTPSSRRPWLFRKRYKEITRLLEAHVGVASQHTEEFSAQFQQTSLRGLWNLPPRNLLFTGREAALKDLERLFSESRQTGVVTVATVGLGGIGKTQLAIEFCHRQYSQMYGLICWLRGESVEALMTDLGSKGKGSKTEPLKHSAERLDEILAEQCSWALDWAGFTSNM
eukprot:NODE_2781_length_1093_cov_8.755694_g2651_i0.p1 GENE.NODE_2781_length_1093_cov_8.755694_g2651_i0~~NODE_2781_length_1093_cov_8.755694_g2651_i0.p1  ORF type:complete len:332 (+),score=58.07 NODE_2781_length_1093_cov_8.755694_g2651_i0:39-1034(+)